MFLGRESEVTGKNYIVKTECKQKCIVQNGVSHIDVKKISDCLCSMRKSVR